MGKIELTVQVDQELAEQAKASGQSLDTVVEEALRALIDHSSNAAAEARARTWAEENAGAIREYNERIARRGTFGADLRRW